MKKNYKNVLFSAMALLVSICLCLNSTIAYAIDENISTLQTLSSWQDKVDPIILEKMNENSDEKIPVWLWMEDIDLKEAERRVYEKTGLKESNLAVVDESLPKNWH